MWQICPQRRAWIPAPCMKPATRKRRHSTWSLGTREQPTLLQASVTIDPYVRLFSPYRREFLERLRYPSGQKPGQQLDSQGAEDKEPFLSLQQFARGQTAQLSYCGTPELRYRSYCLSESDRKRFYE